MCPNCTDMRYLFLSSLLALGLTASSQVPDYVPTDGLVAWFDFGNGLEDQTGNLELTLHGGAQLANGALDVSEYGAWAESSELPSSFEGNPEFSVVAFLQCQMEHVSAASWGIGGGSDAGAIAQNINSWNHNSTNQVVLDLWGTTTLGAGLEYNQESFDVAFWSKANSNFSSDNILLGLNGDVVGGAGLTYLRGQSNQPNLPSGGKLFLGKAGLEDAYYGPFKIKSFGLFDRALDVEEYILIRSNLVAESQGCISANACNYDASAMFDDGSCEYGCLNCGPGTLWDDASQLCIVANPSDTNFDGCVSMTDLLDLLTVFGTCNETPWSCGDPLEYQGYDYETVQIGDQCWFAENARHLPFVSPSNLGWEDDGGAHAYVAGYQGTIVEEAKMEDDYATFGALYNFAAVEELVMCPQGWHVPSVMEWNVLEAFAGPAAANKLKSAPPVWDGTNELGFNAIRVPVRISSGSFGAFNVKADFWTSSPSETSENNAWGRELNTGQEEFTHDENGKNAGQPVRCLKDSE